MAFIIPLLLSIVAIAFVLWASKMNRKIEKMIGILAIVLFSSITFFQFVTVIPAGHVGVVDFFGTVSDKPLPSGVNFVNPLAKIVEYSIQTNEHKETMSVLSREGLTIGLEVSVLYRLNPDSACSVYKTVVGGDYQNIILIPQFRSISRAVTASFQASALYSTEREQLGISIQKELAKIVSPRGVEIENTPIRNVTLPDQLTEAIEQKQKADQESQRMEFILTKEKQEAERKRIEAQGISDFQKIVTLGISDQLLRWKGIEATENLAKSNNAKIVIIGSGKDGIPVILGNDK